MSKPRGKEYIPLPLAVPNLSNWSVTRVMNTIAEHEQGNFAHSAFLWDALDRNPRTSAALNRRIMTVQGLPTKLDAGEGDGRKNDAAVKRLQPYWRKIFARPKSSKLLRGAIGMGVQFGQEVWRLEKGDLIPKLQIWHNSFFRWDNVNKAYEVQTASDALVKFRPGDGNWFVFGYDDWDEQPWMRGVVRCIALPDTGRSLVVRDWLRYSECHGVPMRMLEVPFNEGDVEEKKQIIDQVENPGSEMTVIVPKGRTEEDSYKLSLVEPTDRSWESFDHLKKACDVDVALAITGTEVFNETGVYNPKDNSQGVRQDYTEADAAALSDFYQDQVIRPWARFNLGPDYEDSAPRPCIDSTPPLDKQAAAQTLLTLGQGLAAINAELREIGQEVDPIYLEQYGIKLRKSDVKPPSQVAAEAAKKSKKPGAKPA
jgi:phage gp29-like protein